jgi:hypothetical protein
LSDSDLTYFGRDLTGSSVKLSKIDQKMMKTINPNAFAGFSFVNEKYNEKFTKL